MHKLKDFLYNWNDVILAIVVLLAAVGIILWRVAKLFA
jgi:hypothetical protein